MRSFLKLLFPWSKRINLFSFSRLQQLSPSCLEIWLFKVNQRADWKIKTAFPHGLNFNLIYRILQTYQFEKTLKHRQKITNLSQMSSILIFFYPKLQKSKEGFDAGVAKININLSGELQPLRQEQQGQLLSFLQCIFIFNYLIPPPFLQVRLQRLISELRSNKNNDECSFSSLSPCSFCCWWTLWSLENELKKRRKEKTPNKSAIIKVVSASSHYPLALMKSVMNVAFIHLDLYSSWISLFIYFSWHPQCRSNYPRFN